MLVSCTYAFFFLFQAEDGIRDLYVTGVQTCALPISRQPLRLPLRGLTPAEFDQRLEAGDRRAGRLLYTQACPACTACEPIRVDVRAFTPSRSQRRAQARGDAHIEIRTGPLEVDERRIALYLKHLEQRG